jgi:hypothetical protein
MDWLSWLGLVLLCCCNCVDPKRSEAGSKPGGKVSGGGGGGGGGPVNQVDRRGLAALIDDSDYVAVLFLDGGQQYKSDRISESLEKVQLPKLQVWRRQRKSGTLLCLLDLYYIPFRCPL